jgi:hypothetical protein
LREGQAVEQSINAAGDPEYHRPHPLLGDVKIARGFRLPGEIHERLFPYQRDCKYTYIQEIDLLTHA